MTKRLPFDENSFDLIFHPVSNCYVYAVLPSGANAHGS